MDSKAFPTLPEILFPSQSSEIFPEIPRTNTSDVAPSPEAILFEISTGATKRTFITFTVSTEHY